MTWLMGWRASDRAFDFSLIVALGVTLLSGAAWAVSLRLRRQPAIRHLVLFSALMCCIGMPALAAAFAASGWSLISIPLLPAAEVRPVETIRFDSSRPPGRRPLLLAPRPPDRSVRPEDDPRSIELNPAATSLRESPATVSTNPGPTSSGVEAARRPSGDPAGSTGPYRLLATLGLIVWGFGSLLLLLGFSRGCREIRRLRLSSSPVRDDSLRRV